MIALVEGDLGAAAGYLTEAAATAAAIGDVNLLAEIAPTIRHSPSSSLDDLAAARTESASGGAR